MKSMDFERITTSIFRTGDLNIKLMLLPNRKQNASGNLLTGSYINTYSSQQYSDRNQLSTLDVNFNTYIDFEFLKFVDKNRISESVLVSYPHLENLNNFLVSSANLLIEDFDNIYTNQGIDPAYNEWITSEGLTSNKILGVVPSYTTVTINNISTEEPGVLFLVKDENYVVELTLNAYLGLVQDVTALTTSANLRSAAMQLYSVAQMDFLIHNIGGSGIAPTNGGGGSGAFNAPSAGGGRSSSFTPRNNGDRPARGLNSGGAGIPRRSTGGNGLGKIGQGANNPVTPKAPVEPTPTVRRKPVEVEETTLDDLANSDPFPKDPVVNNEADINVDAAIANTTNPLTSKILAQAANEEFDISDEDIDF